MPNPLHPENMSTDDRLAELAAILAAGVIRIYGPKSSNEVAETGEISLDFAANQSGSVPKSRGPDNTK